MSKQTAKDAPSWQMRIDAAVSEHGKLKQIADAARMSSSQLQKIANGSNRNPGVKTLERIAIAMNTTLPELMRPTEARPEQDPGDAAAPSGKRHSVLDERYAELLSTIDTDFPAEDTWQGDVHKAIAALNRALRRPAPTGQAAEMSAKARR